MRISDWSSDVCSSDLLCVQCALVSADSLQAAILRLLLRRPELARRYLAVEGHRALAAIEDVLPPFMYTKVNRVLAQRSDSSAASLQLALSKESLAPPPEIFGTLRSEEHTSEFQSLMRISYAVFCLKKHTKTNSTD